MSFVDPSGLSWEKPGESVGRPVWGSGEEMRFAELSGGRWLVCETFKMPEIRGVKGRMTLAMDEAGELQGYVVEATTARSFAGPGERTRAITLEQTMWEGGEIRSLRKLGDSTASGGVYLQYEQGLDRVMRAGRSGDPRQREYRHANAEETRFLRFEDRFRTDASGVQRRLEQLVHDAYRPPLDRIRPIDPLNPNRGLYLAAACNYLAAWGGAS